MDTEVGVLTVPLSKSVKQDRLFELGVYQNRTRPVIVATKSVPFLKPTKFRPSDARADLVVKLYNNGHVAYVAPYFYF